MHATCALGRARVRKAWVLREAGVWRDAWRGVWRDVWREPPISPEAPPPPRSPTPASGGRPAHEEAWPSFGGARGGRYLRLEPPHAAALAQLRGYERIASQLRQLGAALRLARALNRTLVLPPLHCGAAARAYPCRAGAHRT